MSVRTLLSVSTCSAQVVVTLLAAVCLAPAVNAQTTGTIVITSTGGQTINPGASVSSAYQASVANPDSTTSVTDSMSSVNVKVSVACPNGQSQNFSIPLPSATINIPAGSSAYYPSAPIVGTANAPSKLCGGRAGVTNGLTFTANNAVGCHSSSAQGCCKTVCNKSDFPNGNGCKPMTTCTSGQKGGCCK